MQEKHLWEQGLGAMLDAAGKEANIAGNVWQQGQRPTKRQTAVTYHHEMSSGWELELSGVLLVSPTSYRNRRPGRSSTPRTPNATNKAPKPWPERVGIASAVTVLNLISPWSAGAIPSQ